MVTIIINSIEFQIKCYYKNYEILTQQNPCVLTTELRSHVLCNFDFCLHWLCTVCRSVMFNTPSCNDSFIDLVIL